jgi:hypothetical protein
LCRMIQWGGFGSRDQTASLVTSGGLGSVQI